MQNKFELVYVDHESPEVRNLFERAGSVDPWEELDEILDDTFFNNR